MNSGSGLAITTSCKDVEGALQFIDDLLSQDIHNLRFWGVEGVDYEVNDDGCFIGQKNRESRQQIRHTKHHTFVHILISQTIKERVMMVSMQIGLMINRMNFLTV